jgi:ribonuclease HI
LEQEKIYLWADGACRNNQSKENIGGYGAVLKYKDGTAEFHGAEENTTNNKMELTSIIVGLGKIKDKTKPVVVTMDSTYVIKGITEWSKTWKINGFKNSKKHEIENINYWRYLLDLVAMFENIEFVLCKGHSDNKENQYADDLANKAMDEFLKGKEND